MLSIFHRFIDSTRRTMFTKMEDDACRSPQEAGQTRRASQEVPRVSINGWVPPLPYQGQSPTGASL